MRYYLHRNKLATTIYDDCQVHNDSSVVHEWCQNILKTTTAAKNTLKPTTADTKGYSDK